MIIYVSGPYSLGDQTENIRRACFAGAEIKRKGHIPLVPHLSHLWHLIDPHPREYWLEIDLALLTVCDALLRLDGKSEGADLEVEEAKKLCMIIYNSLENIPNVSKMSSL